MTTSTYMDKRKYGSRLRPEGVVFANNPPVLSNNVLVPDGVEFGNSTTDVGDFIILSDHNRAPMNFASQRIENRQRMVNGRMRSYWVADKMTLDLSWSLLPSRAFSAKANFDTTTGAIGSPGTVLNPSEYTVDGGAGGAELLNWYENHYGTFYVLVAYDKYGDFPSTGSAGKNNASFGHLKEYNEYFEMYITDFTYSVEKRGAGYDMWNISIKLEEA